MVYTLNFMYGLFIAFKTLNSYQKVYPHKLFFISPKAVILTHALSNDLKNKIMPIAIGLVFLCIRFVYVPFMFVLVPIKNMWYFPEVITKVKSNASTTLFRSYLSTKYISEKMPSKDYAVWTAFFIQYNAILTFSGIIIHSHKLSSLAEHIAGQGEYKSQMQPQNCKETGCKQTTKNCHCHADIQRRSRSVVYGC